MAKSFYITTPIYYVNDAPHIGHAYTTVAADAIARYRRLRGDDVFFLTGTDEHGQKIERAAEATGESPMELASRVVLRFKGLWESLNISNSDFIRTTEPRHKRAVAQIFKTIEQRGDIYLGEYEGWYDVRNEAFITETQLEELLAIAVEKRPPLERVKEESYFFRLSRFQERLLKFYDENPDFIQPSYRRNEVVRFVEGGLRDLSVSRTSFKWGIPVPGNEHHVIYVWFDALTNYLTAAGYPDDPERFSRIWEADVHLVGKDILRFHAVYWPAFLMSAGLPLPKKVFAHGWWTVEGEKMSKSLGNVVDPYKIADEFGVDAFRYFLLREMPFGQDGDFSKPALVGRINGDLANGLGNLVSRSLGMIERYLGGRVAEPAAFEAADTQVQERFAQTIAELERAMGETAFHKALASIWEFIASVNKYVDDSQPWTLAKHGKTERLKTVLWTLAASIEAAAILIYPFMPKTADVIWARLGHEDSIAAQTGANPNSWGALTAGRLVNKGEAIFPRIKE
ncbi:MAG: methionine--tRNA ligase [Deltaproteobacteria bacterium]